MSSIGSADIIIGADSSGFEQSLGSAVDKIARSASSKLSRNFTKVGETLTKVGGAMTRGITLPVAGAVASVGTLVTALGFKRLVGIDTARGQFRGLGLDAEAVMEQVDKGVTNTSLSMAQGAATAVGILATGAVPLNDLEGAIKRVANVSAAYGVETEHAAYLLNNVLTKQKVTWGDLSQMQRNNIPIVTQLAEHYGVAGDEIMKMAQEGKISVEELNEVIDKNAGKAAEEYAKTWSGVSANIIANLGKIGAKMLEPSFEIIKDKAEDLLEVLRSPEFSAWADDFGQKLGEFVGNAVDAISKLIDWWTDLNPVMQETIAILGGVVIASGPVLTVLGKFLQLYAPLATGAGLLRKGWVRAASGAETLQLHAMYAKDNLKRMVPAMKSLTAPTSGLAGGLRGLSNGFRILGASMKGHPLLWIAGAVAAAAAGLVYFFRETETGQRLWQQFTQALEPIIPIFESIGGAIADLVGSGLERLGSLFESTGDKIGGAFSGVLDTVMGVLENIIPVISGVFENIIPVISGIFETLSPIVGSVIGTIGDTFAELLPVIEPTLGRLAEAGGAIIEAFAPLVPVFQEAGSEIIEALAPLVDTVVNELMPAFADLGRALGDAFGEIALVAGELVAALAPLVGDILVQFANIVGELVGVLAPLVGDILAQFASIAGELLSVLVPLVADILVQFASIAGELLSALAPLIADVLTQFVSVIAELLVVLAPLVGQVLTAFADVISTLVAALAPLVVMLIQSLVPVFINIVQNILPVLIGVLTAVIGVIAELVVALMPLITTLLDVLIPVIEAVLEVVVTVVEAIVPIIEGALQIIIGIVETFTALLDGNWSEFWDGILATLSAIWETIEAVIDAAINIVLGIIESVLGLLGIEWEASWTGISDFVTNIWDTISTAVSTAINWVKDTISNILSSIQSTWDTTWSTIRTFFSDIWNKIQSAASEFFNGVKNKFTEVTDYIQDIPNKILGFFSNIGTTLLDSGKALVNGFLDGIKSAWSTLTSWVSDGLQKVRNLFPFSPARTGPFSGAGWVDKSGESLGNAFAKGAVDSLSEGEKKIAAELGVIANDFASLGDMGLGSSGAFSSGLDMATSIADGLLYGKGGIVAAAQELADAAYAPFNARYGSIIPTGGYGSATSSLRTPSATTTPAPASSSGSSADLVSALLGVLSEIAPALGDRVREGAQVGSREGISEVFSRQASAIRRDRKM